MSRKVEELDQPGIAGLVTLLTVLAVPVWTWALIDVIVHGPTSVVVLVATMLAVASRTAVPFLTVRGLSDRDRPGHGVVVAPALVLLDAPAFVVAAVLGVALGWIARRLPALTMTQPARRNTEVALAITGATLAAAAAAAAAHLPPWPVTAGVGPALTGAVTFVVMDALLRGVVVAAVERRPLAEVVPAGLRDSGPIEGIALSCGLFVTLVVVAHGGEAAWLLLASAVALALAIQISTGDQARARYQSLVKLAVRTEDARTPAEAEAAVVSRVAALVHAGRGEIRDHPPDADEIGVVLPIPGPPTWLVMADRQGLARPFTRRDRDLLQAAAPLAATTLVDAAERAGLSTLLGTDPLTDLANRRALDDIAPRRIADDIVRDRCTAVVVLDVDDFKPVNDDLGHDAGDAVLVDLARLLRRAARSDDLVARLGGDEFAVVATGLPDPSVADAVADRLRLQLSSLVAPDGRRVRVSLGMAVSPRDGQGIHELLRAADRHMYMDKRAHA